MFHSVWIFQLFYSGITLLINNKNVLQDMELFIDPNGLQNMKITK